MTEKGKAIIIGAGKTGRGFIGYLCHQSGYSISLVDKNKGLIEDLQREKKYDVEILGDHSCNASIPVGNASIVDSAIWHNDFCKAEVAFVSIVGSNFPNLAPYLAAAIKERYKQCNQAFFNIITCENYNSAAAYLKQQVSAAIVDVAIQKWMDEKIGFSESMILCTSLAPAASQHPLTVRTQKFFELPCDGEAFKGKVPAIAALRPLLKFGNQLERKIYTYNCINAVISYMGGNKGYTQLSEATNDPEILKIAEKAGYETSQALIAEYGFDPKEQAEWVKTAIAKFANRNIPDPIDRNAADVKRKMSRNDRLIGPALFCLKHGIIPQAILQGIFAAFQYNDKDYKIINDIEKSGIESVLQQICGLKPEEKLYKLIVEGYTKKMYL